MTSTTINKTDETVDLPNTSIQKFDVLLCLNGTLPASKDFFDFFTDIPIIAADGAAHKLQVLGISPTFVIGDLDSFRLYDTHPDFLNTTIIHLPDQESNDFEKCLQFCCERNFHSILVCGFHGGIIEHSFNNWSVLMRYSQILTICVYEEGRYAVVLRKSITLSVTIGEILSLIPQPCATITTTGLQWNLTNEQLEFGVREGARNCAIAVNVSIEIHQGEILLFYDARLPFSPILHSSSSLISSKS
jgi:thiamine pyrophosphokinase